MQPLRAKIVGQGFGNTIYIIKSYFKQNNINIRIYMGRISILMFSLSIRSINIQNRKIASETLTTRGNFCVLEFYSSLMSSN